MTLSPELFYFSQQSLNSIYFYFPKVFIATLCGIIIGVEREYRNKPAGVRTMVLICVGCAVFTALSFHVAPTSDASRIIAQIVTGVGFLGGGVIMKNEDKILGVTTAAFIWVIAAIGVMIGLGETVVPLILTTGLLFISIILTAFETLIHKVEKKRHNGKNNTNS